MYFKEGFIEDLLAQINILEYISERVELTLQGKYFWGLCPFHQEKSPSFMVDPLSGTFTCFGCGITGNVITFVMKYKDISFNEAVKDLACEYEIEIELENSQEDLINFEQHMNEKKELINSHIDIMTIIAHARKMGWESINVNTLQRCVYLLKVLYSFIDCINENLFSHYHFNVTTYGPYSELIHRSVVFLLTSR